MTGQNLQVNGGLTLRRNPLPSEIEESVMAAMRLRSKTSGQRCHTDALRALARFHISGNQRMISPRHNKRESHGGQTKRCVFGVRW